MRVLQLHNRYQQTGGEDVVVSAERQLLERHGHVVDLLEADNDGIAGLGGKVKAALGSIYSTGSKSRVAERIRRFCPDVVHVHNFFPLLSPSVYYACRETRVPVVQTIHNYRLICPNAVLLRSGRPCEDCVGRKFAWPGVIHSCYRGSRLGTASVASMSAVHRLLGTWRNQVDAFVALSDFAKRKLAEGGLPEEKVTVKPNFVPDSGLVGDGRGGFALFVGRLAAEKGIATLLSAWDLLNDVFTLKVAGDGPLREKVMRCAAEGRIEYVGARSREEILDLMRRAALLIFPSLCYETFGLAIAEAFSGGLPVLASDLGSMASLVEHGRTGLLFRPGDAADLAAKIEWAVSHPEEMARMREAARTEYLVKFTPERNYELLMQIYDRVTDGKASAESGIQGTSETRIPHAGSILS